MFVNNPLGRGCIGTCQNHTMPFVVDYDGSIFLHLEQRGVVSISEIEVVDGDPIIIGPLWPESGGEFTFWFKDEDGNRIVYNNVEDYDGFTIKIISGYDTVALGACDDCESSPFIMTPDDINYMRRTLLYFPNDEAALAWGLKAGDWYILSQDSDIGVWGTPKVVVL